MGTITPQQNTPGRGMLGRITPGHIVGVAAAGLAVGFIAWLANASAVQDAALIAVSVIAGLPIAKKALAALRYKTFSIDLLVTIAVIGAIIIGEYVESSVVAFLFLFGAFLEKRSLERTRASIRDLVDSAPTTARVLRGTDEVTVPLDEVAVGDHVIVRAGDSVPVDGRIVSGAGHLGQAAITGEPVPVERTEGDEVFAGTTLENGFLTVEAAQVGDDTAFARIIELVEDAQDAKTPRQQFLDRFASFYTPAIIVAAIAFALITRDIALGLTFLVIACPGALVIATPVAVVAGIGNGAKRGVILKGGDAVERLAKIDTVVLDKTGTLTEGHPEVTAVRALRGTEDELLAAAASLELASEHPLGRAVVRAARERNLDLHDPDGVEVQRGIGLTGTVAGSAVAVGSFRIVPQPPDVPGHADEEIEREVRAHEDNGETVSHVVIDGVWHGYVVIADALRPGAAEAMRALHAQGVTKLVMLTGDNPRAARHVAEQADIDEVHAQLLPEDKVTEVQRLVAEGRRVAMVGDGLNDAPALATANVGIAMGAGTDVSVETADVVLAGNRLEQLAHAHGLARRTVRIMIENTTIALVTVALLLLGVILEQVGMSIGMLVHEVSVLLVIVNALRLTRWRSRTGVAAPAARRAARPALVDA